MDNSTSSEIDALEKEQQFFQRIVFSISILVTVLFLLASLLYTKWLMKKLSFATEESIEQELKSLSSRNLAVDMRRHSSDGTDNQGKTEEIEETEPEDTEETEEMV
mmetsp:Transcript_2549/g.3371  ORF Transcript_2549/g.3371 Transcript_2549/m.3371 type:complete len:106 (-) Transcript_2549:30-347(-)